MMQERATRVILDETMHISGPLVVLIGAMHGNETAGVQAIERVKTMLQNEPQVNPAFRMRGRVVGLIGNLAAYQQGKRYLDHDLNRLWHRAEEADASLKSVQEPYELQELAALKSALLSLIEAHEHEEVLILDLHTTSADGGIFSIALESERGEAIASAMHAPMVKGLLDGIAGTLLHYLKSLNIKGKRITALAFESGMHTDPNSVERAISAVIHALRGMGNIAAQDVEPRHQDLLKTYGQHLPKVVQLRYVHKIAPESGFAMRPGYKNFQAIGAGEHLADDAHGPITAPCDGLILMPLYQKQGTDGFFVVT
jgi:succinylglutamate desuccinylase